jgi:aromatic-L-amino-acid/L-tryptophan decarboxylase
MRADALAQMVKSDLESGLLPCAVVATIGSTATTACDPLTDVANVAQEHGLWMHVDAALAGSAMILPEYRKLWDGIEGADSLVTNPHKWLGASFDCSTYFVRDPDHLVRVMSTNPSFLRTAADSQVKNFRDWGIPLGRRFRALKLWFLIREQGVSGLQARLRRDIGYAQWLAARVDAAPLWKRVAPVPLQTVCVRHEPSGLSGEALDKHTLAWVKRINESGKAYLTSATLDGRWMVRVAFGGEATQQRHVEELWELMQAEAARG